MLFCYLCTFFKPSLNQTENAGYIVESETGKKNLIHDLCSIFCFYLRFATLFFSIFKPFKATTNRKLLGIIKQYILQVI